MSKEELASRFYAVAVTALEMFTPNVKLKLFLSIVDLRAKMDVLWFIKEAGPFFYKYREAIARRDVNYFITLDYKDQREDWMALTRGYGESLAVAFENSIKMNLAILKIDHPGFIETCGTSLLAIYCNFLKLEQAK